MYQTCHARTRAGRESLVHSSVSMLESLTCHLTLLVMNPSAAGALFFTLPPSAHTHTHTPTSFNCDSGSRLETICKFPPQRRRRHRCRLRAAECAVIQRGSRSKSRECGRPIPPALSRRLGSRRCVSSHDSSRAGGEEWAATRCTSRCGCDSDVE